MDENALPHEDRPKLANARRTRNFLILAIALLLLKLLLVSQREIVPEADDAESYVRHSLEDPALDLWRVLGSPAGRVFGHGVGPIARNPLPHLLGGLLSGSGILVF
jgi:hypothetical protein